MGEDTSAASVTSFSFWPRLSLSERVELQMMSSGRDVRLELLLGLEFLLTASSFVLNFSASVSQISWELICRHLHVTLPLAIVSILVDAILTSNSKTSSSTASPALIGGIKPRGNDQVPEGK